MKTIIKSTLGLFVLVAALSGCTDRTVETITYDANVPIYMSFDDFRASFKKSDAKEISQLGKIYFKDGYLFVNEYGKGIHVINNANPENPQVIAFYEIMGNVDMAIRGNILFADSYIDLVAIDISDVNNPLEVGRLENVFPEVAPEGEMYYPYAKVDRSKGVIVGWKLETVTEDIEVYGSGGWLFRGNLDFVTTEGGGPTWTGGAGVGGSMARFMLNEQFLYLIAVTNVLKTVDVTTSAAMSIVDTVEVFRNMETLFRLEDKLFIGTTTGMLIFSLDDPAMPREISSYDHITACDPVVVDEQYAYVTLRTGTVCAGGDNLLEVIDISSIENPYLVKSYPMFNPHGLGLDGDLLFVCDGDAGLKVYNKSNPLEILSNQIAHFPDFNTYDVIPFNGVLMLVGQDGIYQYDYSNPQNLVLLSHIPIIENK